jgi:hypothetical protein
MTVSSVVVEWEVMMSEYIPHPQFRFWKEVSSLAPKPGHHLGTLTFTLEKQHFILWLIEGPENDAISFRVMSTSANNTDTQLFRFKARGPLIEQLNELPFSPYDRGIHLDLKSPDAPLKIKTIDAVFSSVHSPNGVDPDAAIALVTTESGQKITVNITELRRGWLVIVVIGVVAIALSGCASVPDAPPGADIRVTKTFKYSVTAGGQVNGIGLGATVSEETTISYSTSSTTTTAAGGTAAPSSSTPTGTPSGH